MTTAFGRMDIDLTSSLETLLKYVTGEISKVRKDLFPSFEDGYEFKTFDRVIAKMKHIKKLKKVDDFSLEANPPKIIEKEPSVHDDEEGEDDEEVGSGDEEGESDD